MLLHVHWCTDALYAHVVTDDFKAESTRHMGKNPRKSLESRGLASHCAEMFDPLYSRC